MVTRSRIIQTLRRSAVSLGLARRARRRSGNSLLVIAYHNIIPDRVRRTGDVSLHLPISDFRQHLDFLKANFEPISLRDISSLGGARGKPRIAITFDDAYAGAVNLAIPEMTSRGIPATVFVCPGLLGQPAFWWDHLACQYGGLNKKNRSEALEELGGVQERVLGRWRGKSQVPEEMRPARMEELDQMAKSPSVTVASHTWDHPNLARLTPEAVRTELTESKRWLEERYPGIMLPSHLSFPYGLFNEETLRIAEALGFRFLYKIDGGNLPLPLLPGSPIPRVNIPSGISLEGFELWTSGIRV